jgi:uncharacterized repeat protein (TIGR01451 family)
LKKLNARPHLFASLLLLLPLTASAQPIAYVTNQSSNVVHLVRPSDGQVIGGIPVGIAPTGIAIPAVGGFALVANKGGNSVSRIDLATSTVTATIPVPGNPTAVGVTPDGLKAYVVQSTNCPPPPEPTPSPTPVGPTPLPTPPPTPGPTPSPTPVPPCTVAVIDTASNTVVTTVTVGHEPFAVGISPSGGFAYVTNRADDSVSIIDTTTDTVIDELPVGDTPEGIFAGFGEVYVANDASNSVSVYREIDFQPLTTIPVGASPIAVTVSPDGRTAVAGNDLGASISIIETGTETVVATESVGTNPTGVAITPDSVLAVVANSTSGTITIVPLKQPNPNSPIPTRTINVLGSPSDVAITPTPYFAIEKSATPEVAVAGGTVTYTIPYMNLGSGPGVNTTITDTFPPLLTFVSATGGGALVGSDVVWDLGTVPVGAVGTVEATFSVAAAPPLLDGDELTNVVTIADALGNSASAELTVGTRVPGGLGLIQGNYNKKNAVNPRDAWRFKAQIPQLVTPFDNTQDMTITWSTPTQVITSFVVPAGSWTGRTGSNRFNFSARDLISQGSRVRGSFALRGNGLWRLNYTASNLTLPLVDLPPVITVTAIIGPDVYASTREFRVRKTSKPNTQRLSYRSVIAGD